MILKRTLLLLNFFLLFLSFAFTQTREIYVSDAGTFSSNFKIFKFDENGENPEVFISQPLAWPQDILFLEDQGVVLISNLSSGNIAKHNAMTGDFIENFATGIGGPTRMKIGADTLLYVLQWGGNGKVLRYQLDGTFVDEFTSTGVSNSIGIDWDADGNLYVSSYNADKVQKYDAEGNDMGVFINSSLVGPTNIFFDDNGDMIVLDYDGGSIKKFDSNGTFVETLISGLSGPEGIDFFPNGNFIIGNGGTGAVKMYDADYNFIEDLVPGGTAGLLTPNAIVIREVMPVSVSEPEVVENFIIPSIGSAFFLNNEIAGEVESIEIYDAAGNLVKKAEVISNQVWQAGDHPEGLYFITIRGIDHSLSTQKIIVRK